MSYRLFIQFNDEGVRPIRDIKEFASEWGWNKAIYESRIIAVDMLSSSLGKVVGELSPHFLAAMTDDFLAARVYFDSVEHWDSGYYFRFVLNQIPRDEQVVGIEIAIDQETRKSAELRRWNGSGWVPFRTVSWK